MFLQLPFSLLLLFLGSVIAAPSGGDPNALFGCLRGKGYDLETISNANYATDSAAFNRRLTFQPVALVFPHNASEVADIVHCAATNSFKVSARSGGHSYAAFGLGGEDGHVIVDLRNLNSISAVDSHGLVTSGTGNRLGDLATAIWNSDQRALPHGTCPYVGTGGHTSYGGFGLFSRKSGLLLDHVVSAEVVLANGTVVTASNTSNTDLFWAIRGAAPSYGIVTSWTYQTVPAVNNIGFTIEWSSRSLSQSEFITAFGAYQTFSETAPNDLGFDGDISADGHGGITLTFLGVWYGDASQFNSTLAPFLSQLPQGYTLTATNFNWLQQLVFLSGSGSLSTATPDTHDTFFAKSLMTTGPVSQTSLASFANFLYTQGVNSDTNWFIGFDLYGGANSAISQISSTATAYANRNAFITFQFYASSSNSQPPYPSDGISFVDNMLASVDSNPQEAYPNYVDPTLTGAQWKQQYFGANYPRLLSIKNAVDPGNVFSFPQAIGQA